MDQFNFDTDSRIAQSRHRIREQFENYKRVENYYSFFFAYMALLGYGIFDIFVLAFRSYQFGTVLPFQVLVVILICIIISTFYYFARLIWLKGIHVDPLPKNVYSKYDENELKYKPEELEELKGDVKKSYLSILENAIDTNQNSYDSRKKLVGLMLKSIILAFILYIPLLTYTKMAEDDKIYPKQEGPKTERPVINIPPTIQNENRAEKPSETPTTEVVRERSEQQKSDKN